MKSKLDELTQQL